ncbi:MAG: leucine-rich repeat domain-containing protein [Chitinophagaceae bacterium]
MTKKALALIKAEMEKKTGKLDLKSCELTEIPEELSGMHWLKKLDAGFNEIREINNIDKLIRLEELGLQHNEISEIKNLDRLINLVDLDLSINKIKKVVNIHTLLNLETLKLYGNKIKEIERVDILVNLRWLDLGGNQISEIKNLEKLINLQTLNLYGNKLEEIENLDLLVSLRTLLLGRNRIKQIKNVDTLVNLEFLGLEHNEISELRNLNRLYNLSTLSLHNNNIQEIKNLNKLRKLELVELSGNPITGIKEITKLVQLPHLVSLVTDPLLSNDLNIPAEIFSGDNCLHALRGYFASLKKGQFESKEVPVILIGNSTAGKTSLRYFLQRNIFPPPLDHSTHGIEPSIWQPDEETFHNIDEQYHLKDTQFYMWDFGGQEYYHSTHRLFFSKKAIYIIVWEQKTNKQATEQIRINLLKQDGRIEATVLPVELFPYEYWLSSIRHLAGTIKDSPILLLQNKMDEEGNREKGYPDPELVINNNCEVLQLDIKTAYEINGRGKKDPLVDIFLQKLFSAAKNLSSTIVYGGLWEDIKKILQAARNENIWSPQHFLAELRQLDPVLKDSSMLSYAMSLRAMGLIMYEYEDAFLKDFIFINPGWVTEQLYSILDAAVLEKEGEFDMAHVVNKVGEAHAGIFIALMKKFELIFENEELNCFIAPQYLPVELNDRRKDIELKTRFDFDKPDFVLQFTDFMPRHIMLRFLVAYGKLVAGKYYWRNGVAFTLRSCIVLVLCDCDKKQFRVFTENGNKFIQRLIFEKLVQLSANTASLQLACGTPDFIAYPALTEEFPGQKFSGNLTIKAVNGKRVSLQDLKHFFEPIEAVKTKYPILAPMSLRPKKIKVFISYAHADNEKGLVDLFVQELKGQLKALEDDYLFTIFKDDQIIMGSEWDSILQKEVITADVAILLLSSSFLQSQYINKNELEIFLRNNVQGAGAILAPVYFDPFMFNKYTLLKPYQFFKPNGQVYGPEYAHLKDDLCYGDLVRFDPQSGLPLPNRNRSRYMIDFVEALEKALNEKNSPAA